MNIYWHPPDHDDDDAHDDHDDYDDDDDDDDDDDAHDDDGDGDVDVDDDDDDDEEEDDDDDEHDLGASFAHNLFLAHNQPWSWKYDEKKDADDGCYWTRKFDFVQSREKNFQAGRCGGRL